MNYVIVPSKYLKYINFSEVAQTAPDSLRYSIDNKYFLLKYTGDQPDFVYAITKDAIGLQEYPHSEFLSGPQWSK